MSAPKHPASERRLAANRANAQKSTGPRTSEGKAASSRNAVKHGFTASSFSVVRLEDLQELAKLKEDAVACYRPVNAQELFAVERIAMAQLQIFRGARLEPGLFTDAFNEAVDPFDARPIQPMSADIIGDIEITRQQNRNYALAGGFRKIARESNIFSLMLRYQAKAEREYRRAIEEFERLKALRDEMPNEPNIGAGSNEPEDIAPLEEINYGVALDLRDHQLGMPPAPGSASTPASPRSTLANGHNPPPNGHAPDKMRT